MNLRPFQIERYFAKYEFNSKYLLCNSDMESFSIQEILDLEEGSEERFRSHWLGYTESAGALSLRNAMSRMYDHISPQQILVHSGAEEAIFLFMLAIVSPQDHVIVHSPCYQSLQEIVRGLGCQISLWEANPADHWELDLQCLEEQIQSNTRLVITNMPHNPTGYLMSASQIQQLAKLLEEKNILWFSDEVYRESEYSQEERLPAACDLYQNATSLGVMSKAYGLAGLRIGWIATQNSSIFTKIATFKDYTTICNSAPSEFLAELALQHKDVILRRNASILEKNRTLLENFFAKYPHVFQWIPPKAGPIAFPKFLAGDIDSFCEKLHQQESVLLLPGTVYGNTDNHFRIGFGRKNFAQGLLALERFVEHELC